VRHDGIDFGSDARALYDGEVAFTDQHVGRLLDAIAKAPFAGRTAVVVTSDHGETFGEHGMYRHGFELWEPLVHVPLIVYVPGAKPHHVAERRSAIDLVPTILDLMRAPKPTGEGTDFVSGVSLLPDLFPAAGAVAQRRDVFVDMPAGPYNDARRALIHDDLKLVVSGDSRFDLFDLASDPGEDRNLADDAAKMKDMKDRYAAFRARLREVKVTGQRK
jgi:arylsulfatase A-like enzyme